MDWILEFLQEKFSLYDSWLSAAGALAYYFFGLLTITDCFTIFT